MQYTAQLLPLVITFMTGFIFGSVVIGLYARYKIKKTINRCVSPLGVLFELLDGENLCHDCGADIDEIHKDGCDVERCSVCGGQRLQCNCEGHDKYASRWTGVFPVGE